MTRNQVIAHQRRHGGLLPDDDECDEEPVRVQDRPDFDDEAWEPPYLSRGWLPETPDDRHFA